MEKLNQKSHYHSVAGRGLRPAQSSRNEAQLIQFRDEGNPKTFSETFSAGVKTG
jgi:hypothetical protein